MAEESWQDAMIQAALAFRLGRDGEGNETLSVFIDRLLRVIPKMEHLHMGEFQTVLELMLCAQERGDYLLVADLLEYELSKLLGGVTGTTP